MRRCPKCDKWELDLTISKDHTQHNGDYYFRCWNCGFTCSKKEALIYPSEEIVISKVGKNVK
jgi:hypothetical protein